MVANGNEDGCELGETKKSFWVWGVGELAFVVVV